MVLRWWPLTLVLIALAVLVVLAALMIRRTVRARRDGIPVAHSERLTIAGCASALVVLLAAATAGRWIYVRVERPEKVNRDIVLCLDVSGSMIDLDAEVLDRYLEMLPGFQGERMSLVLWNSTAAPVFPLTDDYDFVEEQLTLVRDSMRGAEDSVNYRAGTMNGSGASLIGDGLASCAIMFERSRGPEGDSGDPDAPAIPDDGRSRSIILATDNRINGAPQVALPDAAGFAEASGITLYALDANLFPDAFSDEYRTAIEGHGGRYFPLDDPSGVDRIVDEITNDQTSAIEGAPQLLEVDRPDGWLFALMAAAPIWLVAVRRMRL